MRSKVLFAAAFMVAGLASAQPPDITPMSRGDHYARTLLGSGASTQSMAALARFTGKLEARQQRMREGDRFLEYVFYKTHHRFLRNYQSDASMEQLLAAGKYNCLTGTVLYALLLDDLKIPYQITEMTHHIFLEVSLRGHTYLFEATDAMDGFVSDKKAIDDRIDQYRHADVTTRSSKEYKFHDPIYNTLSLEELPGLLYYNQAIKAYNDHAYASAILYLEKATRYYYSSRIDELSSLIGDAIWSSQLGSAEKLQLSQRIQTMRLSTHLSLSRAY